MDRPSASAQEQRHLCDAWPGDERNLGWTWILLMEEILHHLGCIKPCKYLDIHGYSPYQLVQEFVHQQYGWWSDNNGSHKPWFIGMIDSSQTWKGICEKTKTKPIRLSDRILNFIFCCYKFLYIFAVKDSFFVRNIMRYWMRLARWGLNLRPS